MITKNYFLISAIVFALAGLLHALRVVLSWDLVLGGYAIPTWFSVVAVVVTWALAFMGFRISSRDSRLTPTIGSQ